MSNEKIRALLEQLRDEMENTDLDAETRSALQEIGKDTAAPSDLMLQRARELEGKFAANHPTAERLITEVIHTLSKMGI